MPEFQAALPKQLKWSVSANRFDTDGKTPKSLSLFVPIESVEAFARYVAALSTDPEKIRKGKIWNYATQSEEEVDGIYINGKGRDGSDGGAYGNINPAAIQSVTLDF
jgi:hypothetical protein